MAHSKCLPVAFIDFILAWIVQELPSSIAAYCAVEKSHLIFGLSPLSLNEVEPVNASNHFNKATYSVEVEGAKQRWFNRRKFQQVWGESCGPIKTMIKSIEWPHLILGDLLQGYWRNRRGGCGGGSRRAEQQQLAPGWNGLAIRKSAISMKLLFFPTSSACFCSTLVIVVSYFTTCVY